MLKRYLDDSKGMPAQDFITDISPINNVAAERLGSACSSPPNQWPSVPTG